MIKAKNPRHLAQVDVKDLNLYKVSLSDAEVDFYLKESNASSKGKSAVLRIRLQPLEEMSAVFPEPLQKSHIHIVFEHGPGMCPHHRLISSSDKSYFRRIYSKQLDEVLHPATQTGCYCS